MTLSTVRCHILGKAEIHTRGIRLTPESELQFGLAMYFCGNAGRDVPRDDVARLFWPQNGIEAARHNLRQSLYRLRVLGVPVRSGAKSSVLEAHLVEADFLPVVAEGAPASSFMRLLDVSVLPGYSPRFSRAFGRWVEDFRGDIGARMRRGLVRAISEMRARGRYADVERLCRFCLALDPLNEEATLALAEAVALAGGKVEAVGMIDRYASEVSRYPAELRLPASLLRERISDRLIRRSQAAMDLPMIGREEDVERVLTAFQRLRGNHSVSYVINGPAGVGKTRLSAECCRIAELQGARVLTIGTQPSSRTQALFAVSELVDGMLQLPGAIGCAPSALECLRGMSAPLSVKEPPLSLETDGEARFAMVRWSILDVLDAILSEGPLLIHVDDAHQLDAQSQLILQDALRTHVGRPLLLLLSMRAPEASDAERFGRLTSVSTVHDLPPLSDESCDLLVHRFCAVHEEDLDAHTRERIIQLSGGNPFFLLELLKHRSDLMSDDLPVSVQALLEDRLLRLSPTGLTVLRAAAVLGLSSNVERLHRLVERKTSDVLAALTELHNAGMLSSHDSGTVCRHDTIRDAVLERTPTAARRLLHRRAAKVLGREVMKEGGVAELWECLHHWREAGTPSKGLPIALFLVKRLLRLGLAKDALAVVRELPDSALEPRLAARMLALQARGARMLGDWKLVNDTVRKLETSEHRSATHRHSRIELLGYEAAFYSAETHTTLPQSIHNCVGSVSAAVSHRLEAAVLIMVEAENQVNAAVAATTHTTIQSLPVTTTAERIAKLTVDAIYHASFGDPKAASAPLNELSTLCLTIPNPVVRSTLIRRTCWGVSRFVSVHRARELLSDALEVFTTLELHTHAVMCLEHLCLLALQLGDQDEAAQFLAEVRKLTSKESNFLFTMLEYELRVVTAFESGDAGLLLHEDPPHAACELFSRSPRPKTFVRAMLAAHSMLKGQPPSDSDLKELRNLHGLMRTQGDQDFSTSVIAAWLCTLRRPEEARQVVAEYLTVSRRDLCPLLPSLARVAQTLGIALAGAGLRQPY